MVFSVAFLLFGSTLMQSAATVYAGVAVGSSSSISALGVKTNMNGGIWDLQTVWFRVFVSRDPAFYHAETADEERILNNFSRSFPRDVGDDGFFFAAHNAPKLGPNFGIAKYNSSTRSLDLWEDPDSRKRLIYGTSDGKNLPKNKVKDALKDYSFIDAKKKSITELANGKWKTILNNVMPSVSEAIDVWSAILYKDPSAGYKVTERMNEFISPYAKKPLDSLTDAEKDDVAKGYLALLMVTYKMVQYDFMRTPWESAIEDYIMQRDQTKDGKPVTIVVDTAVTVTFNTLDKRIIMPCVDYLMYYTAVNSKYDFYYNTTSLGSAEGDTYSMLLKLVNLVIQDDRGRDIKRISDVRDWNNVIYFGASAIVYPEHRLSTIRGYAEWIYSTHEAAIMDVLLAAQKGNKRLIGFNYAGFHFSMPIEVEGSLVFEAKEKDVEVPPDQETIGQPIKLRLTHDASSPKGQAEIAMWEKILKETGKQNINVKVTWERQVTPSEVLPPNYSAGHIEGWSLYSDWFLEWLKGQRELLVLDNVPNEPISPGTEKVFTYKPTMIVTYKYRGEDKQLVIEGDTDYASFNRRAVNNEAILYTSKPSTYAEFKEGSPDNETFEAMAGVPSTKRLYLGVGGSEFIVDVELEYRQGVESVWRTYRSYFSAVDSEHKAGDNAGTASIGGYTVDLHNGGTYTKTWTGTVPNLGQPVTVSGMGTVTATSVAVPDRSAYNAAKAEALAYIAQVNSTMVSHTASSDGKTRTNSNWNARITTDLVIDPQDVTVTESNYQTGTDEDGNPIQIPLPVTATANPSGPGSFTITVTFDVPAHIVCGPECNYVLPAIEDTWKQKITFDYLKINRVEVYKIQEGRIVGVDNVFGPGNGELKATIKRGDPNIFYNIAQMNAGGDDVAAQSSKHGRIRYSLETLQHDTVVWYEGPRSNKSDGQGWNGSPYSAPIGQNHPNARGILYTNPNYTTEKDYHISHSNAIDRARPEFQRFDQRRKMMNTATIISDMLILQTSSGDQSVIYFAKSSTPKQAQEQFDPVTATKEEMWDNNPNSAARWTEDQINIGSYNGNFQYTGTGSANNKKYWGYNKVTKTFIAEGTGNQVATVFDDNGVGVNASVKRPARPSKLMIYDFGSIVPTTPNGAYSNGGAEVFYERILNWSSPNPYADKGGGTLSTPAYQAKAQSAFGNKTGVVFKAPYSDSHAKVNDIVIHTPVSAEDAMIVSLPSERDQRIDAPAGGAAQLIQEKNQLQVCPLDPELCEFRVLNCKYFLDVPLVEIDFEDVTTTTVLNKVTGAHIPYYATGGFTVAPVSGFGNGKVLHANGTRWSLNFSDIGLTNTRDTVVLVEMDFWMPQAPNPGTMIVSFAGYDFYIPANQGKGTWNTGNGWEKRLENVNFVNNKMRLGLQFSFGSVEDSKVFINGVEQTVYTRVNESNPLDNLIGTTLNIGSWGKNNNYPAQFYIDNLKITRKGGTHEHTDACYITTVSHETKLIHVHTESCYQTLPDGSKKLVCNNLPLNTLTQNNVHVHTADCVVEFNVGGGSSVPPGTKYDFSYTGNVQTFTVPETGKYQLEVWGAQGGSGFNTTGGKGGYAKGDIYLTKGQVVYIYVGGQGSTPNGGWNGGGNGGIDIGAGQTGGGGGGATDIRVGGTALSNRVIVAGGGAGGGRDGATGVGGGYSGTASESYNSGYPGQPGTQTGGGSVYTTSRGATPGSLGQGGNGSTGYNAAGGGGGGGGYYGGGGGTSTQDHGSGWSAGGGGGSGYIGGVQNGVTIAGDTSMPNPNGGTEVGHSGNGFARITFLGSTGGSGGIGGYTWEEIFGPNWQNYVTQGTPVSTEGQKFTFNYTGSLQIFTAPETGIYTLEVWGAQGGNWGGSVGGGKGGYAKGDIRLTKGEVLYIYVGGRGGNAPLGNDIDEFDRVNNNGGWNGGGSGSGSRGAGGGGATDIRKGGTSYSHRIIVAGGGGGAGVDTPESYGGNTLNLTSGPNGESGDTVRHSSSYPNDEQGGGGGYQGGKVIHGDDPSYSYGGSNYVGGVTNSVSQAGVNTGHGKAVITFTKSETSVVIDWNKVRADVSKGVFPEYMPDGLPNPIFGCISMGYIGDTTTGVGPFKGRSGSGVTLVTVNHPNANKDVSAVRLNAGAASPSIATAVLGLAPKGSYTVEFDYWSDSDNVKFSVDLGNAALPKIELNAKKQVQHYKWEFSSENAQMANAVLRILQTQYSTNPANVYITSIRIYLTPTPNQHVHTENCKVTKVLNCTEPHHYGGHYDEGNPICWDACGIDENHRHNKETVTLPDGSAARLATFINLDYEFTVYFPNVGDFAQQPNLEGIGSLTTIRGKGYVDDMDTTEYTAKKRVRFPFHVFYNGRLYTSGSWIDLAVNQSYYTFYAVAANKEASAAMIEFEAIPINGLPTGYPVNENYQTPTNRERNSSFRALHGAYKTSYVDVVGRIGNFVVSDTEDFRFSNLFKQPKDSGGWIMEGLVREVDPSRQNQYYGDIVDIRGVPANQTGYYLNTYGTQKWLEKAPLPLPINPKDNNIPPLQEEFLKVGYDILADITTLGNYQEGVVRVLPYYYKLDLDTGEVIPLDVYVKDEDRYRLVNEYRGADDGELPSDMYPYGVYIDWEKEASRRNYSMDEAVITERVANEHGEYIFGPVYGEGSTDIGVIGIDKLKTPLGNFIDIGNAQRLVLQGKARSFIGTSRTYGFDYDPLGQLPIDAWDYAVQRWHLKFGLPSSAVFVEAGKLPTEENIADIKKGNGVILLAADIIAIGNLYTLRWDQPGISAFTVTVDGVTRAFNLRGSGIPPVIALFDLNRTARIDVDIRSSH